MKINLKGKIALVTGASGELGRVMSRTLARCGADVAVHYHKDKSKALALCGEIRGMGGRSGCFQADITRLEAVLKLQREVKRALGSPDIIVNNAVIQYPWKKVLDQPQRDYESQFRSCVLQTVFMAKAFAPDMIRRKWGRIIAINTECAMQNFPTQSAYAAGKRGLDGVIRVLAKEIGEHQVTVNEVAPGWTISDRDREKGSEKQPAYDQQVPLKRRGTDQEAANAVAFLASDLASFITGAYLPVCGGNVMPTV